MTWPNFDHALPHAECRNHSTSDQIFDLSLDCALVEAARLRDGRDQLDMSLHEVMRHLAAQDLWPALRASVALLRQLARGAPPQIPIGGW